MNVRPDRPRFEVGDAVAVRRGSAGQPLRAYAVRAVAPGPAVVTYALDGPGLAAVPERLLEPMALEYGCTVVRLDTGEVAELTTALDARGELDARPGVYGFGFGRGAIPRELLSEVDRPRYIGWVSFTARQMAPVLAATRGDPLLCHDDGVYLTPGQGKGPVVRPFASGGRWGPGEGDDFADPVPREALLSGGTVRIDVDMARITVEAAAGTRERSA